MASGFSHAVAALSLGTCFYRPGMPKRVWLAGALCSVAPDLDVIGFRLTSDKLLFASLAQKGSELVSLHMMESPKLDNFLTRYEQPGDHLVEKISYTGPNPTVGIKSGRVYISRWQYFEGVPKEVWEFHIGGHQVREKWLKDRKDRKLSSDDIDHYQKIIVALSETIRIMKEIDDLIPGWPLP